MDTSKTAQNDLLECIGEFIQGIIVEEIKQQKKPGPLFGIQADEVTDISNKEQMGVVLRYIKDDKPVERLVKFNEVPNTTGESLAECIMKCVENLGLKMSNCHAQSYDGAANMAGKNKGVAARISSLFPLVLHYYCMTHDLNLALSKACSLPELKIMLATYVCLRKWSNK